MGVTEPIVVHLAVIEWTDDMDVDLFADRSEPGLWKQIREHIEETVIQDITPEWEPELRAYLESDEAKALEYDAWYERLHEQWTAPWVTTSVVAL